MIRKTIKGGDFKSQMVGELVFDQVPEEGSFNPVTSDAVAKIAGGVADLDAIVPEGASEENKLATAADVSGVQSNVDTVNGKIPSDATSDNKLVSESTLQDAIEEASESWSTGFTPKGESSVSDLNDLATQSNGDSYIVTDSGTLTDGSLAVVAGEQVAWDATNSVWYKLPQYALKTTTDNLADSIADEFVPNSTTTVAGQPYMYDGLLYIAKEDYQGPWDANKFYEKKESDIIQNAFEKIDICNATISMGARKLTLVRNVRSVSNAVISANGFQSSVNGYTIKLYRVYAGDTIYIFGKQNSNYTTYQFSTAAVINVTNRVGESHGGSVDGVVSVPTGAAYLAMTVKTDEIANYGVFDEAVQKLADDEFKVIENVEPITTTLTSGYISGTGTIVAAGTATKELVTDYIDLENKVVVYDYKLFLGTPWAAYCFYDDGKNPILPRVDVGPFNDYFGYKRSQGSIRKIDGAKYVRICFRTYDDYSFSVYKRNDFDYIGPGRAVNEENAARLSSNAYYNSWFKDTHFYSHLFIDVIESKVGWIYPCQSLACINAEKRLGFGVVECNAKPTATPGKYICMHGVGANALIGNQLYDPNGTDITEVSILETSFDTLRTYRYRSPYAKQRTPVVSLEEYLEECKKNKMVPLVYYVDDTMLDIVMSYFGDDFILYTNGFVRPKKFKGMMMVYTRIAGVSVVDAVYQAVGNPCLLMANNDIDDAIIKQVIDRTHALKMLFGFVGCYKTEAEIQNNIKLGADVVASAWNIPFSESGNIVDFNCFNSWSDVATDGTVDSDYNLVLADGESVSFTTGRLEMLAKEMLTMRFSGTIKLTMSRKIKNASITSDGTGEMKFSTYLTDTPGAIPAFTVTADGGAVTIYTLGFKASRC